MRWTFGLGGLAALLGVASASSQANTVTVYNDPETGFTFSQYQATYSLSGKYITFRIAVPSDAQQNAQYDSVVQIVAPSEVGWLGLAWGGSMTYNPLTVSWANGGTAVVSSRYATGHVLPSTYSGATYEVFKTGTRSNGTHWQFTAKCSGCTSYSGASGSQRYLNPKGGNRLAFAYSASKPSNPSSASSSFNVHDVFGYWTHDFSLAQNPSFSNLVTKNGGHTSSNTSSKLRKKRIVTVEDDVFAEED
ncbi:CBD9-like protein [Coniochaeta sp. PMI_546]|nr:CBD9-like protein [Coniochaeta sp. PMI_546]